MSCKHAHQPVHVFKINSNEPYSQAGAIALERLRSFLQAAEPQMIQWLYATWKAQGEAIKYKELRDAIVAGDLSLDYLKQWQQDYAYIINKKLAPAWLEAMEAAANQLKEKYPEWVFDPNWPAVQKWIQEHGSDLAVNLTQTQHDALRQVINRAAFMEDFSPDELSRAIRPLVGMVPREAMAVLKYYESLRNNGMTIKQAKQQAANYAGRVHRHRAMRIARTELCFAYNRGIDEGIKQAQAQGYIGQVQKRWMTADDETVCEICGLLDGQVVAQDAEFSVLLPQKITGHHRLPPAHPHCRCTVIYEEDLLYTSTWGINAANDYGTEAWLKRQPKWEQERLLGGKNKRILFEAGVLKEIDYSKSLTELKNNGIIIVSKKTVKHSTIGEISDFKNPKKPEQGGGTFKSGGHSQKNIDLLDALQKQYENSVKVKANYEYNIVKEYSNGVRVGHVALHGDKNKRNGIEQTWFPKDWDDEKIHVAGTYVANLKEKYIIKRTVFKHAVYENVEVAVCIDPITKEITTIFPDKIQAHLKE